MTISIPEPLIEKIKKGRASLFLGAGASEGSGFPGSKQLTKYLISKAGEPIKKELVEKSLSEVVDILNETPGYGNGWVREKIISLFMESQKSVNSSSKPHNAMTKVKWRTIYTTNFDCLIEQAYMNNSQSVQQFLPVYHPDLKLKSHESERVRIIKLHGSIDEAARNSHHSLICTFNEMQEASRRNALFYEILRDDAVTGPLIFVGFSFRYPGTSLYGTSTELELLQQILVQMGPSAEWHYCIIPKKESNGDYDRLVDKLKSKKILVINATFEEFIDSVIDKLKEDNQSPKRIESITVPVKDKTITIRRGELLKDKRHFTILNNEMFKGEPPSVRDSINGLDNWLSFYNNHLLERDCKIDFINKIENNLKSKDPTITIISAPLGWGKSFLLKDIGVEFFKKGIPVIWLNPFSNIEIPQVDSSEPIILGRWDNERLISLIMSINNQSENKVGPILIADECSERSEDVFYLYNALRQKNLKCSLIFSTDEPYDSLREEYPLPTKAELYNPPQSSSQKEILNLIDFCFENEIISKNELPKRDYILSRIRQDEADTLLIFALQVIYDKEHRPFSEIVRNYLSELENENQRNLVFATSTLNRFGSLFGPRLYTLTKIFYEIPMDTLIDNYNECLNKRILIESEEEDEPCVFTRHPLIADKYLEIGKNKKLQNQWFIRIIGNMGPNLRDIEIIRKLSRKINSGHGVNLDSEMIKTFFETALKTTNYDWVICQQYSKFLLNQEDPPKALEIINIAIKNNPKHLPLYHSRGNIRKKWGERLHFKDKEKSIEQFRLAAEDFSNYRLQAQPNEYGFVTELDMLIFRINHETDPQKIIDYKVEGRLLYEQGLTMITSIDLNYLMNNKYKSIFSPTEEILNEFCAKIESALADGTPSVFSISFYAKRNYNLDHNNYNQIIKKVEDYQKKMGQSVLLLVTEAELHSKESNFIDASRCLDSAKRILDTAEKKELKRQLFYWELIVSFILKDYKRTQKAQEILYELSYIVKQNLPRGNIWKSDSRDIDISKRTLRKHGVIFKGIVEYKKVGRSFMSLSLNNDSGESFYLKFNPKYFGRGDFRVGDEIDFVISILPHRLRADNPNNNHFLNTPDNIYV